MLRFRRFIVVVTAAVLSLSLYQTLAKEIVKVTISGPGLAGTVEVTDEGALSLFQDMRFKGMLDGQPSDAGKTFYEIQLVLGHDDQIIATDIYNYYPASDGGYMFYADVINGWSSAEGKWFRVEEATDHALREFIARQEAATAPRQPANWLLALLGMIRALLG